MKAAYDYVRDHALDFCVAYCTEGEIDEHGISWANMKAMHRALDGLTLVPEQILVDGSYFQLYSRKGEPINYGTVVHGDGTYYSIAAASILAKYSRDKYIDDLCDQYPALQERYDLKNNKGYISAPRHKAGIEQYGISEFHRACWKPCKDQPVSPVSEI